MGRYSRLVENTLFLYILTFSNQFLNLMTIPYLTRILGPSVYGKLGVAMSLALYIQLFLDFGFILSATERVATFRDDNIVCGKIFTAVTIIKIALVILTGLVFSAIVLIVPAWKENFLFFLLFYIAYAVNSFLPDYIYRGKEQMSHITYRTVCVKLFFTLMVFLFIKGESDFVRYPVLLLCGNVIAVVWALINIKNEYGIGLTRVNRSEIVSIYKDSAPFFCSRISATMYQAATTIIIGLIYANQPIVGYYSSVDKIMTATKTVSSPIADSLYPYMLKNKDYKLIKRILLLAFPIIVFVFIIAFIFADSICVLLFGTEYQSAGNILRCILPAMAVIFPTYILCFPVLCPLGLEKYANFSNVLGAVCQIVFLLLLFITKSLNAINICIFASISEMIVFLYRVVVVLVNRKDS